MQEQCKKQTEQFVKVDQLVPLEQFRDWIEKPENLNLWMRYPNYENDKELHRMRLQAEEVLKHPSEASPTVIFNVAIKLGDLTHFDPNPKHYLTTSEWRMSAYRDGLTALSRSNKFSIQEHGHYWNTLTTLIAYQSIFVQQGDRRMSTNPPINEKARR